MSNELDIENQVRLSMKVGGEFYPLGTYSSGARGQYVNHWLEEALAQTMKPSQWEELSRLLRDGFNDHAAKLICDVAEAYARRCAMDRFENMTGRGL